MLMSHRSHIFATYASTQRNVLLSVLLHSCISSSAFIFQPKSSFLGTLGKIKTNVSTWRCSIMCMRCGLCIKCSEALNRICESNNASLIQRWNSGLESLALHCEERFCHCDVSIVRHSVVMKRTSLMDHFNCACLSHASLFMQNWLHFYCTVSAQFQFGGNLDFNLVNFDVSLKCKVHKYYRLCERLVVTRLFALKSLRISVTDSPRETRVQCDCFSCWFWNCRKECYLLSMLFSRVHDDYFSVTVSVRSVW